MSEMSDRSDSSDRSDILRILFLGDICAKPGREAVVGMVPGLRRELGLDFVIANAENSAAGYGITPQIARELLSGGIDCLTLGDHFLDRKEIARYLDEEPRLLRPLNYVSKLPDGQPGAPGTGVGLYPVGNRKVGVLSLLARTFMKPVDSPFQRVGAEIEKLSQETRVIIVDFHGEATAEKLCMGWFLDGRVSAVLGTHTHVPTADERILPNGTAYITDVGMCGGMDSVLGMRTDLAIKRMMLSVPLRLEPARKNIRLNGVLIEINAGTGKSRSIRRIDVAYEPANEPGGAPGSQSE
jgi:metallophosphoesterase (TIGR00282 family)